MAFITRQAVLAAAIAGVFAACGGTAVIDAGAGGAGGAGSPSGTTDATSTTSSVGSVNSTAVSSSTGMIESFCASACDSLQDCGGGLGGCFDRCLERAAGPCGQWHQNWISCSLGETNTMCGIGPGQICGPDLQTYLECTGEIVDELGCSAGPDGCFCSLFVSPGIDIAQSCGPNGCQCLVGGVVVGLCPTPEPTCDVVQGCCAGVLFTGGI